MQCTGYVLYRALVAACGTLKAGIVVGMRLIKLIIAHNPCATMEQKCERKTVPNPATILVSQKCWYLFLPRC